MSPQRVATVAKTFRFEAAHVLPNHTGKCARPHGHSYRVEVAVSGRVRPADGAPDEGMVLDFGELSEAWRPMMLLLDHCDLNATLPSHYQPPTAEHVALFVLDGIELAESVTVWETETCRATVSR